MRRELIRKAVMRDLKLIKEIAHNAPIEKLQFLVNRVRNNHRRYWRMTGQTIF